MKSKTSAAGQDKNGGKKGGKNSKKLDDDEVPVR